MSQPCVFFCSMCVCVCVPVSVCVCVYEDGARTNHLQFVCVCACASACEQSIHHTSVKLLIKLLSLTCSYNHAGMLAL